LDQKAEIVERETVYQGRFRMESYRIRHTLHGGGWSETFTREVFERGHAAAVLPYDPFRDEVVLIEQFWPGPLAAGEHPWLVEIVAGMLDHDGESAEQVVRREAQEEAGIVISNIEPVVDCFMTPGGCSEQIAIFCGKTDSSSVTGIHGRDDEHEDIRPFTLPYQEVIKSLDKKQFKNAITVIALQWLCLNRERIRTSWCT
jgi:ADP-ribose pyrophosphatase